MQTTRLRLQYLLADYISVSLSWLAFNFVRYSSLPYKSSLTLAGYLQMPMVVIGQCVFPLMMVGLFALSGYYNNVFLKSRVSDVLNAAGMAILGSFIIFFTTLYNDQIDDRLGNFEMLTLLWSLFTFFTALPRLVITNRVANKILDRKIEFNTIIVGKSPAAIVLANSLQTKHRSMGFRVLGMASSTPESNEGIPYPVYDLDNIEHTADELNVEKFIIVPDEDTVPDTLQVINRLLPLGKSVFITPDTYHLIASRPRTAMVGGQVLIDVSKADIPASTANLKRLGDIIISAIALVAISPLIGVLALMIKRDSSGPAFYSQERVGYKKKPFKIHKLRTMSTDAEASGPSLSSANDPRITRIGRVLRKYRLDELPQFWNVLKGDMSLVGPRPEREFYLRQIIARAPYFNLIHQVRPGITSWGMVKYGYASDVDQMLERMKYDLIYIDNVSLAVDLKILFYTVRTVITGRGV